MCIVCVEMAKGKLTMSEVRRALSEVALDPAQKEHVKEVVHALNEAERNTKQKPPVK